jgi:hypothetical protein
MASFEAGTIKVIPLLSCSKAAFYVCCENETLIGRLFSSFG